MFSDPPRNDLENHDDIASVLDEVRGRGLISEYLVSWRGREGRLTPSVTVWSEGESAVLKGALRRSLLGLVPARQILVVDDATQAS